MHAVISSSADKSHIHYLPTKTIEIRISFSVPWAGRDKDGQSENSASCAAIV